MKRYIAFFVLMIVVSTALLLFESEWTEMGLNVGFVLAANLLLFFITTMAFYVVSAQIKSSIHRFMRGVYTSFLIKMFLMAGALLLYGLSVDNINRPAIFVALGIYVLYTGIEVFQLMRLLRQK